VKLSKVRVEKKRSRKEKGRGWCHGKSSSTTMVMEDTNMTKKEIRLEQEDKMYITRRLVVQGA
jgi:hypothetical protein